MNLSDIILQQVTKSVANGNVQIPSNVQNQVLGGLSESILGSLTKTAATAGGLEQIKSLLTGKTDAATSPITGLAKNLFTTNILSKLNLGALGTALTGLIPTILGGMKNIIKDQDGDGDVDLNDILLTLKGGGGGLLGSVLGGALGSSSGGGLGSIAGSVLGSILGGKK
jgi:hypothetical protein